MSSKIVPFDSQKQERQVPGPKADELFRASPGFGPRVFSPCVTIREKLHNSLARVAVIKPCRPIDAESGFTTPQVKINYNDNSMMKASVSAIDLNNQSLYGGDMQMNEQQDNQKKLGKTVEMESNYTFNKKKENQVSNFLKLVMAKSYQTNFIQNLMNKAYIKKMHHLTNYQIKIVDDLAPDDPLEDETEQDCFISCTDILRRCGRSSCCLGLSQFFNSLNIPVLEPVSRFMVFWDLFQIQIIVMILVWLPYKISFNTNYIIQIFGIQEYTLLLEEILLALLASDVVVGCNLAFIYKGVIVTQRSRILINYLKRYAFVDLFSLFSVVFSFTIQLFDLTPGRKLALQLLLCANFYILRVTKIEKILAKIQEFFNLNGSLNDMMSLIKMLVIIILIGHITACVWHGVAFYASPGVPTWVQFHNLQDEDNLTLYNYSFYFAIMTMTTVGYGDITPVNNSERLVCNITMFLACGVFAFSVNSIGIVLQNLYKTTMEYTRSVTLINNFMSKNKIHFNLQTRIRSYLEYIMQEEQEMNDEEVSLIVTKLSSHLQDELQYQIRGNILEECKIISANFSQNLIKKLVNVMEEVRFSPEEQIISLNTVDDCSLYLISKGEIDIFFEGLNQAGDRFRTNLLKSLQKGDVFGEVSFLTGNLRTASAFSRGFSKVFKVQRQSFMHLLLEFPKDQERFNQLRDSYGLYSDFSQLKMKCYSCKRNDHLIKDCHVVHYKPDNERIIKKLLYPCTNYRMKTIRSRVVKLNSWNILKDVNQQAKDYATQISQELATKQNTDMEDISFHSNLGAIQEAYEEGEDEDHSKLELEINSVLKSPDIRTNTRSLSRISQVPSQNQVDIPQEPSHNEQEPADLDQFFRKTGIKFTVRTAGFGGDMRGSLRNPNNFVQEVPNEEEESSEEEPPKKVMQHPESSPKQSPTDQNLRGRAIQPRVTFMHKTRKSSATEDVVVPYIRQMSDRSQTYTNSRITQNNINQSKTMQRSTTPKLEKPDMQRSEQDVIENSQRARSPDRRKSTTNTRVSFVGKADASAIDCMTTTNTQQSPLIDFDKMELFDVYFPLNNYENVIKRYAKLQRFFGKKRLFKDTSNYAFNFLAIKKGARLRRFLEKSPPVKDRAKIFSKAVTRQQFATVQVRQYNRMVRSNHVDLKVTQRDGQVPLFQQIYDETPL